MTSGSSCRISTILLLHPIKYPTFWRKTWIIRINKVSKRPNNIDLGKLSLVRSLFVIKLTKLLEDDIIIGNVDEWLVNYKSGDCYSWWKRGAGVELRTLPFKGSISVILWIFSNGTYFWSIIQNTVNSLIFCQYLKNHRRLDQQSTDIWKQENSFIAW